MGRPPELTDELLTRLKAAFAKGLTRDEVAASCGVSRASLYRWIGQGVYLEAVIGTTGPRLRELKHSTGLPVLTEQVRRVRELAEAAKLDRMTLRKRRRKAGRARHGR